MNRPPKHLFSINSGRSGSWYLGKLLATGEGVLGFHEAVPQMIDKYLFLINAAGYEESYAQRRFKVDEIRRSLAESPATIYADSSHMFIKTFHDVVVRELESVEVILLRRKLSLVLRSFMQLSYFDRHEPSYQWMSSPNAATAAIRCLAPDAQMTPYERCIAYLIDIEARGLRFRRENPHIKVHEVTLEEINSRSGVEKLFADLRIAPTAATREIAGTRINERRNKKGRFAFLPTVGRCRREIERYVAKATALGIDVPKTLLL